MIREIMHYMENMDDAFKASIQKDIDLVYAVCKGEDHSTIDTYILIVTLIRLRQEYGDYQSKQLEILRGIQGLQQGGFPITSAVQT